MPQNCMIVDNAGKCIKCQGNLIPNGEGKCVPALFNLCPSGKIPLNG